MLINQAAAFCHNQGNQNFLIGFYQRITYSVLRITK